ncbi:phage tail fiber protein [Salmonella enterica subsp. enterica serovar Paratyphi A]
MSSITAANAIIMLTIPGLFPVPQRIQGFSADNIYDAAEQEVVETAMGVDGLLSGGFVFTPVEQIFSLQADSVSNFIFEQWTVARINNRDVFTANGQTTLTSVNRTYVSTKGYLVNKSPLPTAARILQPRRYMIRWERVTANPI